MRVKRLLVYLWLLALAGLPLPAAAQFSPNFTVNSPTAILMDYESGSVLFERDADRRVHPASLAKLMTLEIVFDELKRGDLKLDEELVVSANAWRKGGAPSGGSTMFAPVHARIQVNDLIQGITVTSGNDACIVFAEALAGNEDLFARRMNDRARELELTTAEFVNSTGQHDRDQLISVRDLAKLAAHIVRTYPEYMHYFSIREFTWSKIRQQNRNPLLDMNIGADGMKTGQLKESGFGLVGTAVQDGQRLIVAINGADSAKERADDGKRLLEWGFRNFEPRTLFREGATVAEASVYGGETGRVALVGKGDIRLLTARNAADRIIARVYYTGPLRAPVEKGKEVARLKVFRGERVALELPLYAGSDVPNGSLFQRAMDNIKESAIGLVRSGVNTVLKK
jgi:serine-type D-Ala-D-Ala carboxypeptidase (penicillin-binding protein 5/6)